MTQHVLHRSSDGQLRREELILIQGGDFKLFERIDLRGKGEVSKDNFMAFIKHEHSQRGEAKGLKYVNTVSQDCIPNPNPH